MPVIDVWNRFFEGEEVLLSEMEESVGEENVAFMTLVVNCGYICSCVRKSYTTEGQKRALTSRGLEFYSLISGLFEAGEE